MYTVFKKFYYTKKNSSSQLNLFGSNIGDKGIEIILNSIDFYDKIEILNLDSIFKIYIENNFGDEGIIALAEIFEKFTKLEELHLKGI